MKINDAPVMATFGDGFVTGEVESNISFLPAGKNERNGIEYEVIFNQTGKSKTGKKRLVVRARPSNGNDDSWEDYFAPMNTLQKMGLVSKVSREALDPKLENRTVYIGSLYETGEILKKEVIGSSADVRVTDWTDFTEK